MFTFAAGLDYVSITVMLTFMSRDEGTTTRCFNLTIIDDLLGNEPDEDFSVVIVDADPVGNVGDEACIRIIDDDSECLKMSTYFSMIL